jgi:hypothetical protein
LSALTSQKRRQFQQKLIAKVSDTYLANRSSLYGNEQLYVCILVWAFRAARCVVVRLVEGVILSKLHWRTKKPSLSPTVQSGPLLRYQRLVASICDALDMKQYAYYFSCHCAVMCCSFISTHLPQQRFQHTIQGVLITGDTLGTQRI